MRVACWTQRDELWFRLRCGRVTASNVSKALSFVSKGSKERGDKRIESSADREKYKRDLIGEILTGQPAAHFVTRYMDDGREGEPLARAWYDHETGLEVEPLGFVLHPTLDRFGASPDGYTVSPSGARRCQEFKIPSPGIYWEYLRTKEAPKDYYDQMQTEMLCTETDVCDWCCYCPTMPKEIRGFIVPIKRDEQRIKEIEEGVVKFLEEAVAEIVEVGLTLPMLLMPEEPKEPQAPKKDAILDGAFLTDEELNAYI